MHSSLEQVYYDPQIKETFITMTLNTQTHTHTPDQVPQVDERVSLICDAALPLLACSAVCDMTGAPQSLPHPTCSEDTADTQLRNKHVFNIPT